MARVQDPACGMMVDPARAPAHGTYEGKEVYFCCPACQRKFEASRRPD